MIYEIAEEIMRIENDILKENNSNTGVDLNKPLLKAEFIKRVKTLDIIFTQKMYDRLEEENYHTANAILVDVFGLKEIQMKEYKVLVSIKAYNEQDMREQICQANDPEIEWWCEINESQ